MASANFSLDLLECPVCFKIPSKKAFIFCDNGHMVCKKCRNKISNCPTCRSNFADRRNILLEKILDTVKVSCKYKIFGCSENLEFKDLDDHLAQCQFRKVYCFNFKCQAQKIQYNLSSLMDHYEGFHPG